MMLEVSDKQMLLTFTCESSRFNVTVRVCFTQAPCVVKSFEACELACARGSRPQLSADVAVIEYGICGVR